MDSDQQTTFSIDFSGELPEFFVRGVEVYYYKVCPTKLWLFSRGLTREYESELVVLGRILHEKHFKRHIKNVLLDGVVSIDFISYGDKVLVHEVKRSDVLEEADRLQVQYYILHLLSKGVEKVYGVIHYPRRKKRVRVWLDKEGYRNLKEAIRRVEEIKSLEVMPTPTWKSICGRCSYFEFCWVDRDEK